jgi:hypothetical protein
MSTEENKAVVRREFEEMLNQGGIWTPPRSSTPPTTSDTSPPPGI